MPQIAEDPFGPAEVANHDVLSFGTHAEGGWERQHPAQLLYRHAADDDDDSSIRELEDPLQVELRQSGARAFLAPTSPLDLQWTTSVIT